MGNYKFVNPYNFAPLGSKRSEAVSGKGKYNGVINYSLLTKTPLFIPNTSNADVFKMDRKPKGGNDKNHAEDHKSYDFFTYTDLSETDGPAKDAMPVIPGSEIRGMFRSYYEILTNSCMSAVDEKIVLSKRTNEYFKPGLLYKKDDGHYDLYAADDDQQKLNADVDVKEGQKIKGGYALKGESGPKKKRGRYHCFHLENNKKLKKNISLDTLDKVLHEYKRNNKEAYKEYSIQYGKFKDNAPSKDKYFPVYYSNALDGQFMLSPACITREIYTAQLSEFLNTYQACDHKGNLCPACSLFGTIGDGRSFNKASRIRFSDLKCDAQSAVDCYMDKVTLAPLSSPKINNMEFYLKRPAKDAVFWTYGYYIDVNGKIHDNDNGIINGRKFFWHNMKPNMKNHVPSNQNMTIRSVRPNISFKGQLYFHNISKTELDQLIYLLNGGDDEPEIDQKKHGYKLGSAKPLGLGSVAVSVNEVIIHEIRKNEEKHCVERQESHYNEYSMPNFDEKIKDQFAKMTNFTVLQGKNVDYPRTQEEGEIYEWFTENHVKKARDGQYQHKMPNRRTEMAYAEYMEAMEPELRSTKQHKGNGGPNRRNYETNKTNSHGNRGKRNEKY